MLSDEGTENGEKATIGLIRKKGTLICSCSTLFCTFLSRCFERLQHESSRNFLVTLFLEEMLYVFSFTFVFTAAHFYLALWPLAFLMLSPPLQNYHVLLPQKKMSPFFFISRSRSLSLFLSLSFAGLPPTFSFSLSFSCSIFQICGHDN